MSAPLAPADMLRALAGCCENRPAAGDPSLDIAIATALADIGLRERVPDDLAPAFTASIDAAHSLVAADDDWEIMSDPNGTRARVGVWFCACANLALSLTAAALHDIADRIEREAAS